MPVVWFDGQLARQPRLLKGTVMTDHKKMLLVAPRGDSDSSASENG
jgi:hypothetical protein